jgi:hypothetical protein
MSRVATQDDYVKTALRLPRGLHGEVMAAAEANGRSFNAEIIARLSARALQEDIADIKRGVLHLLKPTLAERAAEAASKD